MGGTGKEREKMSREEVRTQRCMVSQLENVLTYNLYEQFGPERLTEVDGRKKIKALEINRKQEAFIWDPIGKVHRGKRTDKGKEKEG